MCHGNEVGRDRRHTNLFQVTADDQWERNTQSYELFRRIWRRARSVPNPDSGRLHEAEVWPRPLQNPIRIWHGSTTSKRSVALAARYGDPLFSANVTNPIEPYPVLVRHYRERWAHYGHDPALATVRAGTAGY